MNELHPHDVYERLGGVDAFVAIVESFYARVERDDLLRPQYPADLEPGKERLARFLAQYFGGGDVYSRDRGHPRLRMRHAPFVITPEVAGRWATHMSAAIRDQGLDDDVESILLRYVEQATPTMINALPEGVRPLPGI
ncbi:MAG: globin [Nitriliruptoraceae bacterium]